MKRLSILLIITVVTATTILEPAILVHAQEYQADNVRLENEYVIDTDFYKYDPYVEMYNNIIFTDSNECVELPTDSSGGGEEDFSGSENAEIIWNFFKSKGLGDAQAAGILGNLKIESGLSPTITNSIGATGLAQWLGGRLTNLKKFADSQGGKFDTVEIQLKFIWHEITETSEKKVMEPLKAATTPEAAAEVWDTIYERSGHAAVPKRKAAARAYYDQYKGTGANSGDQVLGGGVDENGCPTTGGGTGNLASVPTDRATINTELRNLYNQKKLRFTYLGSITELTNPSLVQDVTARALLALIMAGGIEDLQLSCLNIGHRRSGRHPQGLAFDLDYDTPIGKNPDKSGEGVKAQQFLINNREELKLYELGWQGSSVDTCMQRGEQIACSSINWNSWGDHTHHIHAGFDKTD